jgi:hypothetical protein
MHQTSIHEVLTGVGGSVGSVGQYIATSRPEDRRQEPYTIHFVPVVLVGTLRDFLQTLQDVTGIVSSNST